MEIKEGSLVSFINAANVLIEKAQVTDDFGDGSVIVLYYDEYGRHIEGADKVDCTLILPVSFNP